MDSPCRMHGSIIHVGPCLGGSRHTMGVMGCLWRALAHVHATNILFVVFVEMSFSVHVRTSVCLLIGGALGYDQGSGARGHFIYMSHVICV